ncbi:hypothetical protein [Gynuella sunshinyii]|uniref:Uncharacterized protein n=1 Tax=Gynuella sunshinyii YC6258 TaxID=1445510 RepID=A0A0C5VDW2_9GAMM|nr:hypothetical protein [Gynuella sunshinyii]AJQ97510.1 hypothetical Protein YC6258_05482 [Gynuella sunshinyii YC6258]
MSSSTRKASVTFTGAVSEDVKRATNAVSTGMGNVFPDGHHKIKIRQKALQGSYAESSQTGHHESIAVDMNKHTGDNDTQRGKLAATLVHEMSLHALPDLTNKSLSQPETSADHDHKQMYSGTGRGAYLQHSRSTFNQLQNPAQRTAFANEWLKDQNTHINRESNPTVKAEAQQWAQQRRNSMVDALTHPQGHPWAPQPPVNIMDELMSAPAPSQHLSLDDIFAPPLQPQPLQAQPQPVLPSVQPQPQQSPSGTVSQQNSYQDPFAHLMQGSGPNPSHQSVPNQQLRAQSNQSSSHGNDFADLVAMQKASMSRKKDH